MADLTRPPEPGRRLRAFRRFLVWLGGADPDILEEIRTERAKYEGIGTAVLTTGTMASLSFGFALHMALNAALPVCIVLGLVWGVVIMGVDRLLITTMNAHDSIRLTLLLAGLRLALAVLIGIVISTPLVLRIFQPEINAGLVTLEAKQDAAFAHSTGQVYRQNQVASLTQQLAIQNEIIGHHGGDIGKQETDQAVFRYEATIKADQAAVAHANTLVQCDIRGYEGGKGCTLLGPDNLSGASPGLYGTNPDGWGTVLNKDNAQLAADQALFANYQEQRLTRATAAAKELSTSLATATTQLNGAAAAYNASSGKNGLLDRLDALSLITSQRPSLRAAHYFLLALITAIECLPVLVKTITSLSGPGAYDIAVARAAREESRYGASAIADASLRRRRLANLREQEEYEKRQRSVAKALEVSDREAEYRAELAKEQLANWFEDEQSKLRVGRWYPRSSRSRPGRSDPADRRPGPDALRRRPAVGGPDLPGTRALAENGYPPGPGRGAAEQRDAGWPDSAAAESGPEDEGASRVRPESGFEWGDDDGDDLIEDLTWPEAAAGAQTHGAGPRYDGAGYDGVGHDGTRYDENPYGGTRYDEDPYGDAAYASYGPLSSGDSSGGDGGPLDVPQDGFSQDGASRDGFSRDDGRQGGRNAEVPSRSPSAETIPRPPAGPGPAAPPVTRLALERGRSGEEEPAPDETPRWPAVEPVADRPQPDRAPDVGTYPGDPAPVDDLYQWDDDD